MNKRAATRITFLATLLAALVSSPVQAKQPPHGIVGDVLDAEILIVPELSGSLLRRSNFPLLPSRITTGPDGALYVIDNDENDDLSEVQAVALYDKDTQRTTSQWSLLNGGGLRDVVVSNDNHLYLLDNQNKSIEVRELNGNLLREIQLDNVVVGPSSATNVVNPDTIALDSNDNIYVLDKGATSSTVFKFSPTGRFQWSVNQWDSASLVDINDLVVVDITGNGDESLYLMQDSNSTPLNNTSVYQFALDSSQIRLRNVTNSSLATFLGSSRLSFTPPNVATDSTEPYFYIAVDSQNGLRIRRNESWSTLGSNLGGSESQWNGISTLVESARPNLDVAAVSFNEIYIVDANDGLVRRLGAETTSNLEFLNTVEPPLGSSESIDEELRSSIAELLSDSSFTSGVNVNLLAYDPSGSLVLYRGNTEVFNRVSSGPLLPTSATLAFEFDYDTVVMQANRFIAELASSTSANSCINTHLVYVGPGVWTETDRTIDRLSGLSRFFLQVQPVGYSLGEDEASPQRVNIQRFTDAVNQRANTQVRPKFPLNQDALTQALGNFLNDNAEATSTVSSTAPSLTSQIVVFDDGIDRSLLRARFEFLRDTSWRGHLEKFTIGDDDIPDIVDSAGNVLPPIWNAGEILAARNSASRKLWSVSPGLPQPGTGYNNFVASNAFVLNPFFFPELLGVDLTNAELRTNRLIRYVRGENVYDEAASTTTAADRAWKLADIYNGEPLVIGGTIGTVSTAPEDGRTESGYRGSNGYQAFAQSSVCGSGVICANRRPVVYAPGNDGILHAFDWATGEELWGFVPPQLFANFVEIESGTAGTSRSIFGVDASPVSKDVLINGQWRTILIGNLGRGGKGFFVLDITNPESPAHLFSIQNDTANNVVKRWSADGSLSSYSYAPGQNIPATSDYSHLGETWSEPVIIAGFFDNAVRNFAIFGGGYNNKVDAGIGDRLFAIDLDEGGDIAYQWDVGSSAGIANAVPATPVAVTLDAVLEPENYDYGAIVYVGDLAGRVWKFDLTGQMTSFENRQRLVYDGEATRGNGRYIFNSIAPSINEDEQVILTFGTGDIDDLSAQGSSVANHYAGVIDSNFPNLVLTQPATSFTQLQDVTENATATCPLEAGRPGWSFLFDTNERLIAAPDILNQTALFTTYTPGAVGLACRGFGFSTFRELDISCGTPSQAQNLGEGVARKVNIVGGRVAIAIAAPETSVVRQALDEDELWERTAGVVSGVPSDPGGGDVRIELWRQVIQ